MKRSPLNVPLQVCTSSIESERDNVICCSPAPRSQTHTYDTRCASSLYSTNHSPRSRTCARKNCLVRDIDSVEVSSFHCLPCRDFPDGIVFRLNDFFVLFGFLWFILSLKHCSKISQSLLLLLLLWLLLLWMTERCHCGQRALIGCVVCGCGTRCGHQRTNLTRLRTYTVLPAGVG